MRTKSFLQWNKFKIISRTISKNRIGYYNKNHKISYQFYTFIITNLIFTYIA